MGKNLKGKECGKGICQRKDGFYYARFVDKYGKRHEKYVPTLPEARNWLEEARFADTHDNILVPSDMTVDAWFEFWQENMIADLAPNTRRNYRERYVHNIQPVIGGMLLSNVKPYALQGRPQQDGSRLCWIDNSSSIYYDGDHVQISTDE